MNSAQRGNLARLARLRIARRHRLQAILAMQPHHLLPMHYADRRVRLQPARQITRHGRRQRRSTHQHMHAPRRPAQIHRRLAGRIPAAYNHRRGVLAIPRLDLGRRVINPRTLEMRQPVNRQQPILHAGRHNHRPSTHPLAIIKMRAERSILQPLKPRHMPRQRKAGAELHRLHLARATPGRHPKSRSETPCNSLSGSMSRPAPPTRGILNHQRPQPFRAGINPGPQPPPARHPQSARRIPRRRGSRGPAPAAAPPSAASARAPPHRGQKITAGSSIAIEQPRARRHRLLARQR